MPQRLVNCLAKKTRLAPKMSSYDLDFEMTNASPKILKMLPACSYFWILVWIFNHGLSTAGHILPVAATYRWYYSKTGFSTKLSGLGLLNVGHNISSPWPLEDILKFWHCFLYEENSLLTDFDNKCYEMLQTPQIYYSATHLTEYRLME